ncbi:MAG TPA: transcription-repair coupling factor, partial [Baekduia sp.]|nr:transcription-repair coupling factor [Baekduia sp.]
SQWLAPRQVRHFPARGVTYESHLTPPPHLVGMRIAALDALLAERDATAGTRGADAPVVVVSAPALSEKVPDPALRPKSLQLAVGDLVDLEELAADLVQAGYERVGQVDDRGQFAVRGGILDVYPATADHAVRVDMFDIEVESLRRFSTFTQQSLGEVQRVEIAPAREIALEHLDDELIELLGTGGEEGTHVPGAALTHQFHSLLELLPSGTALLVAEEAEIAPALADQWQDVTAAFHDDAAHDLYLAPDAVLAQIGERAFAQLSALHSDQPIELRAQAAEFGARSLTEAEPQLEKLARSGYRTVVTWRQRGSGERTAYNLARVKPNWLGESGTAAPAQDEVWFAEATLRYGFIAAGPRIAVVPEHRLLHRRRSNRDKQPRRRGVLRSFTELRTGEYVVHEDHGVGRFAGFETKTVAKVTRDYLHLEFDGDDKVFLPVEQLSKISRYLGSSGGEPKLSKLGGKSWETLKARARHAAQELAGELLNLYAERRKRVGHQFPDDSDWLLEFEAKFPHTETADQREAIEHVKRDMESAQPMDRLICGDVGYGKTEVALRAAFKCADDGKQVLVLAPTTILAQQHFGNFSERLRDYPFTIDHVSRFRTPKEQRDVVAAFNEGKVDILIGTHRLLGRDMRGKDIGLIIVDEEQRFGVAQKELLRQLKLKVDVIAMSATPIPRTLQMSLAGVRDISVIETPPEGRRPVKTYVGEYDEELVKTAIMREHERGGQAFFVHNRVESIDETAERLRGLCPGVSFEVAHGQLDEQELEKRMFSFLRGEADVLVATSIIESGIDIPQANTLIVERADMFGLAQLYQIRGRVGRSSQRAYSYLLYPAQAALTEEAMKRLTALSDHTELGAGFKVAMRDLEIRGAGNLLGDEQSGHVAALGFELYLQMLDEAVAIAEGEGDEQPEPVRLDVAVDAYIPADYIEYEQAKIEVHRRIAGAYEVSDLAALRTELADRFGELPEPLENLLDLQQARIKLGRAGARAVSFRGELLSVTPIDLTEDQAAELRERAAGVTIEPGRSQVSFRVPKDAPARFKAVIDAADALLAVTAGAPAVAV